MKMKTTMKYHLTPIMNDHHQKSLQTINAGEGVGKGNPPTLLVGMQIGTATMEVL